MIFLPSEFCFFPHFGFKVWGWQFLSRKTEISKNWGTWEEPEFLLAGHTVFLVICPRQKFLRKEQLLQMDTGPTTTQQNATMKTFLGNSFPFSSTCFFWSFLGHDLPWLKACQLAGRGAQPRSFLQFFFLGQMKCGLAPSGSFFIQNNWSLERKMQLITMLVATTPLARKALMWYLIVFVSW